MAKGRPLTKSGMLNQFAGSAVSTATGFAVGSVIAPTLAPITQALLNETWAAFPNRPLSASQAAEAAIRGLATSDAAAAEAQHTGYSRKRYDVLEGLAGEPPGGQQLLELRRRGAIDDAELTKGLRQSRMRPEWYDSFKKLSTVLVPVSDLIRMAVREVFGPLRGPLELDAEYPAALTPKAALLGLDEQSARDYWAAHWELPSAEQMAQMHFRAGLTEQQLNDGLRALDYAPTWRGKLATILKPIPSLSDMIRFAVREVYAPQAERDRLGIDLDYPDAFTAQAAMHGLDEQYARAYWAAHWRLPSAQQGYRMLWRGELDLAGLDGLLKALDYPKPWRDRLRNIAYAVPGRVDLRRMLEHGVIDRAQVKAGYQRLGYNQADAETLTVFAEELAAKAGGGTTSYIGRAQTSLFGRVHTEYTGRQLTDAEATAGLTAAGVPAAEIPKVLELWRTESSLIRTELTQAQIVKAFKKGLYDRAEALSELQERGMTAADAATRLDEG